MNPLLSMRGIARTFEVPDSPPLHILTDVNLDVRAGDHVAIVGRSGTGKSTLLNLIGLIDQPTDGAYTVDGRDTRRLGEARRAHLRGQTFSYVFQSFNLIPGLSTTENVAAPLLYDTGSAFWTRTRRAEQLLASVGLEDKIDAPIGRLSGGEQQRVAIARALARRPRVILADEPTGALDVDTGTMVMELLESQCRETGAALIIITHDLAVAGRARTQYRLGQGVLTPITVHHERIGGLDEFTEEIAGAAQTSAAGVPGQAPSAGRHTMQEAAS
ncbi:ABC transporter ATP-binding protein [Actinomyces qiguomingii]|uniref:ABC transporter ATP-binding protein n=1 Tax=Actinomyces qiguomingii TaxID=2057800 RepID=UPI000CA032BC|nr:ABC transporter ATP-binding protein [Actinomyces qiguomingii]